MREAFRVQLWMVPESVPKTMDTPSGRATTLLLELAAKAWGVTEVSGLQRCTSFPKPQYASILSFGTSAVGGLSGDNAFNYQAARALIVSMRFVRFLVCAIQANAHYIFIPATKACCSHGCPWPEARRRSGDTPA